MVNIYITLNFLFTSSVSKHIEQDREPSPNKPRIEYLVNLIYVLIFILDASDSILLS